MCIRQNDFKALAQSKEPPKKDLARPSFCPLIPPYSAFEGYTTGLYEKLPSKYIESEDDRRPSSRARLYPECIYRHGHLFPSFDFLAVTQ